MASGRTPKHIKINIEPHSKTAHVEIDGVEQTNVSRLTVRLTPFNADVTITYKAVVVDIEGDLPLVQESTEQYRP